MSYVKIWIHAVWGTKYHTSILTSENKSIITQHIKENASTKEITIDSINGHLNHLHCLIALSPKQCIADIMQLIKGESSYWVNKNNLIKQNFELANEYFAVSISESHVNNVRNYIKNQEEHHTKKSWEDEYNEFVEKFGFIKMKG